MQVRKQGPPKQALADRTMRISGATASIEGNSCCRRSAVHLTDTDAYQAGPVQKHQTQMNDILHVVVNFFIGEQNRPSAGVMDSHKVAVSLVVEHEVRGRGPTHKHRPRKQRKVPTEGKYLHM